MFPDIGVKLANIWLKVLLYADDLVLMAESRHDLQRMLDALHVFCQLNSMTVNTTKSEAVIFNSKYCRDVEVCLLYNGVPLDTKPLFIYLGMLFEADGIMSKAGKRCLSKGRAALYSMLRRCNELDIHNVYIRMHLFDSLVLPILNYGCEVWGPGAFSKGANMFDSPHSKDLECLHKGFLRQCLGIRKSVADWVLMSELQRKPLVTAIFQQTVRFWNKVMDRPSTNLTKMAMAESCTLAQAGVVCWASQFQSRILPLGYSIYNSDTLLPTADITDKVLELYFSRISKPLSNIFPNISDIRSIP
jgi:hypothetical protein